MGSFESGLYDENLKARAEFGLADVFGISKAGGVIGTNGNAYYARIEDPAGASKHPLLQGFGDTNWLPGAGNRVPLKPVDNPLLTVVPDTAIPERIRRWHTAARGWCCAKKVRAGPRGLPATMQNAPISEPVTAICCGCCRTRWNGCRRARGGCAGRWFCRGVLLGDELTACTCSNYTNPDAQHGWVQGLIRRSARSMLR